MTVRWRFDAGTFVRSWSAFEALPGSFSRLGEVTDERRMGVATLALLSTRQEYWVALGLVAGYAQDEDESIPGLVERLAPTGELQLPGTQQILSWAGEQQFAGELGIPEPVISAAIYSVISAIRPEALAAAADAGAAFQLCYDTFKPDMERVMACYRGQTTK